MVQIPRRDHGPQDSGGPDPISAGALRLGIKTVTRKGATEPRDQRQQMTEQDIARHLATMNPDRLP